MARSLNAAKVNVATTTDKPRKLADGGGLFLLVLPKGREGRGRRLWRYKYRICGKEGLYAVGAMPEIGLADARQIHRAARWLVERGEHPAHYVQQEQARHDEEAFRAKTNTFIAICDAWLARDEGKLATVSMAQRRRELKNDVLPVLGKKLLGDIRKNELADLLKSIEARAPEVARNVRQYLSGIFEYAEGVGLVSGSPVPSAKVLKPRNQKPHAALPAEKVGDFLRAVDASGANPQARIAVRLLMLTAVRKVELLAARWNEFDLSKAEWAIPAGRMKMREAHWVPLSAQAVKLLKELREHSHGDLLFPNVRSPRRPMTGNSINALFSRLGYLEQTKPHGLRALFSTYANSADWNPDVIEKCLAHAHKDAIRAKYNRNEYRKEQRDILQTWADQIDRWYDGKAANVLPLRAKRKLR
ncbi:MAG: tyrosine-type recombinase/integrase [Acidiferrobacteraceae bacterium]